MDGEMSALRELSGGKIIIYKVLWLREEGGGRKVAATASCHQRQTQSSEQFIEEQGKGEGIWHEKSRNLWERERGIGVTAIPS